MPRPPLPWLIAYRVLGARLPEQYSGWVARDIAAKGYVNWRIARTLLNLLVLFGLYCFTVAVVHEPVSRDKVTQGALVIGALALLGSRRSYMRRGRRWQRIDQRGNPAPPKGLGLLEQREAVVLAVLVLVAFTAASGVVGHALRPCGAPSESDLRLIREGFTQGGTRLVRTAAVGFPGATIVAAEARVPGESTPRYVYFIVDEPTVYEITAGSPQAVTRYARPQKYDRVAIEALAEASQCLQGINLRRS